MNENGKPQVQKNIATDVAENPVMVLLMYLESLFNHAEKVDAVLNIVSWIIEFASWIIQVF